MSETTSEKDSLVSTSTSNQKSPSTSTSNQKSPSTSTGKKTLPTKSEVESTMPTQKRKRLNPNGKSTKKEKKNENLMNVEIPLHPNARIPNMYDLNMKGIEWKDAKRNEETAKKIIKKIQEKREELIKTFKQIYHQAQYNAGLYVELKSNMKRIKVPTLNNIRNNINEALKLKEIMHKKKKVKIEEQIVNIERKIEKTKTILEEKMTEMENKKQKLTMQKRREINVNIVRALLHEIKEIIREKENVKSETKYKIDELKHTKAGLEKQLKNKNKQIESVIRKNEKNYRLVREIYEKLYSIPFKKVDNLRYKNVMNHRKAGEFIRDAIFKSYNDVQKIRHAYLLKYKKMLPY